ncbi:response regulator transcription factor [Paenibacillus eucommiae]|uniref:Two-component system response regulator YesN n=1 Tax=Paenibacillus eucommiae TaxID=1355755 RepID=A0ABS4IU87_9BACL|nr:response regulator [Paenibacillus eucommiae]MBP1990431.1 two-component system response regulator YesN [Paenibacillus eucommiae]
MYRILIADDEPYIRDRLAHHMPWREIGFEVVGSTENGEQALEMFRSAKPHALLTDILMPGMSGLELIQTIKEQEPRTKLLVMSAYDDFKYAQQAIRLGVKGYLLKPIIPEEFVELLQTVAEELHQEHPYSSQTDKARGNENPYRKTGNPYALAAKRYIDEHYEDKLHLEDVAGFLYMNPNYFSSLFKREMGLSFVDYVNEFRIRKARTLLVETDEKVYEVSIRVGYSNFSYFNKLFKRLNGVTPQAYRELAWSGGKSAGLQP